MSDVRVEQGAKRVRAVFGGQVVADTVHPLLVWEVPYFPMYYIPKADVKAEFLAGAGEDVVREYTDSPTEELRGYVRLDWDAMDTWFEEDEEVFVHPRDPHTRVDILASSRHVRIEIDGVTVADTHSPKLLFETGLPTRYYLPKTSVRLDLAEPSDTITRCPYKGEAEYYSLRVGDELHKDIAWYYRLPTPESQKIAGLVCFLDERVDVFLDGVKQERPNTKFG